MTIHGHFSIIILLLYYLFKTHFRNEFNFWKVHEIMNTSGSCKVSEFARDSMNLPKIEFIAYIYILL